MSETYVALAVLSVIGGGLAWLAHRAFRGLFGNDSPWKSSTPPSPAVKDMRKFNGVVTVLDVAGLTVSGALLAWHFAVSALPDPLLWYFALPLALVCAVGRAKAVVRHVRRDTET